MPLGRGESVAQKFKLRDGEFLLAKIAGFLLTSSLNTESVLGAVPHPKSLKFI